MSTSYDCSDPGRRREGLAAAASSIRAGQLIVLPTDTVYGLGCDAFNADAVRSLQAAKGGGASTPAPVLVGSWRTIDGLVSTVPTAARSLIEAFWPGGLSLVLPHAASLAWELGDTRGTVMLRMPLHPVALELLREVGPMAVSVASKVGGGTTRTMARASEQLGTAVAVYLDGGELEEAPTSTIVDLTSHEPRVLREGAVSVAAIAEVLGTPPQLV